jgi:hypothetical protein
MEPTLTPALLRRLLETLEGAHARDPLIYLVHAQLWEVLFDHHTPLVRKIYAPLVPRLLDLTVTAMRANLKLHALQYRSAVVLTLALNGLNRVQLAQVVSMVLQSGLPLVLEEVLREGAAESVVLSRILRLLDAYCVDLKFRSEVCAEEVQLVEVLHGSLKLHAEDRVIQALGRQVLGTLNA